MSAPPTLTFNGYCMSERKAFHLPDLGEGLPDATIVEWFVRLGETIHLDQPLVSMETAKAVVEVPSPYSGKVLELAGAAGDIINTGAVLARFELDASLPQRAEGHDSGHGHSAAPSETKQTPATETEPPKRDDAGTVVGAMQVSDAVRNELAVAVGGVKAMPAVRAMARKLGIDLSRVRASGTDGAVTMQDLKQAASGTVPLHSDAPPAIARQAIATSPAPPPASTRSVLSATGKPIRTQPPNVSVMGQPEQLKGVRRNMARVMADAHAKVVPTTLNDDADIQAWQPGNDVTVRLIRATVRGCQAVPALNAWFDGEKLTRTLHPHVDIGLAMDTEDGLFVPVLRNAHLLDAQGLRATIERLRHEVSERSIEAAELSGYTISLSNFGKFAGRYATPVVVPPCVAIVAAGRLRHEAVPVVGGFESRRAIPLSLTFDHRACTGGEAARFLKAMLDDLALPS